MPTELEQLLMGGAAGGSIYVDPSRPRPAYIGSSAASSSAPVGAGVFTDPSRSLPAIAPMEAESANLSAATGVGGGQALRPMPKGQSIQDVLNKVQETASMQARAQQEATKTPMEVIATSTGGGKPKYEFKNVDHDDMQHMFEALNFTRQAMQGYQQEYQRLQQQERGLTTGFGPIGNALATVAGNLATADPRLPPIVRALGQSSKDLNPTVEQVRARKLGVASEMADIAQRQEAIIGQEEGRREAAAQRAEAQDLRERTQEERERAKKVEEERLAEKQDVDQTRRLYTTLALATKAGQYVGDEAVAAAAKSLKIDNPDTIDYVRLTLRKEAEEVRKGQEYEQSAAKDKIRYQNELKRANDIEAYGRRVDFLGLTQDAKQKYASYTSALKQEDKLKIVPAKNLDKMAGMRETEQFIDSVEGLLNNPDYAKYAGLSSRIMRNVPPWLKDAKRVKFESHLQHEIPRILELVLRSGQGGASILRTDEGRRMLAKLGVSTDMTVEQGKQVIGIIRGIVRGQRTSVVNEFPLAFGGYESLFGRDADLIQGRTTPGLNAPSVGGAPGAAQPPPGKSIDDQFGDFQQQNRPR